MKILVLSNLFPPHNAGTHDLRCESITQALRLRGHTVLVLTSNHGLKGEQRDSEIERRLLLNGAHGHPPLAKYQEMKAAEVHNHSVLREVTASFAPDLIHVHSLEGLPKSFLFSLRSQGRPVVFDVADDWIGGGIPLDPWLRFWNAPSLPFLEQSTRKALELSGERGRLDGTAPTRFAKGYDRLPGLYGGTVDASSIQPNPLSGFRFDRVYFCSASLKERTAQAGYSVSHGEVIYPGIRTEAYAREPRPPGAPVTRFLLVTDVHKSSGVRTAMEAVGMLRALKIKASITVFGRGDSAYLAELRSLVAARQLPVEFLSFSNINRDMPSVFRNHDAFIYCAELDEPFPAGLLEAMAGGLPVIGVLRGGAAEILRHGENGLVYTSGDVEELSSRMQELQCQPHLRAQMTEIAQQEVLSRFNESIFTDQIESYLNASLQNWAQTSM